jgi:hypothetical protein
MTTIKRAKRQTMVNKELHRKSESNQTLSSLRMITSLVGMHVFSILRNFLVKFEHAELISTSAVTAGGIFFPRGHCNLVALLKQLCLEFGNFVITFIDREISMAEVV